MCGVFGYSGHKPPVMTRLERVSRLAARRGPHACGVAYDVGGDIRSIRTASPWKEVGPDLLRACRAWHRIIGHCRLSTSGDWRNEENNQPLTLGGVLAIAHNGNITGWREKAKASDVELRTECDSELILRRLAATTGGLCERMMRAVSDLADPHVILALEPGNVVAARKGLPLFAWQCEEGIYWCSIKPAEEAYPW